MPIIIPLNEENKKELSETSFKNELGEYKKGPISSLDETKLSLTSKVQPPKNDFLLKQEIVLLL
jgi:hypothetical protein